MSESELRRAANEALFRDVNEQIERLQGRLAVSSDEPLRLVCECAQLECTQQFPVPIRVYERVRADAHLFLVIPGHVDASIESIVDSAGSYLIVRKHPGDPGTVAEITDPRA